MSFDLSQMANELGWHLAGITSPELSPKQAERFRVWIKTHKGPQMSYLSRRTEERLNPKAYFESAKSILTFGLFYFRGWAKSSIKVSTYAWADDYHRLLKEKLETTAGRLRKTFGDFQYRSCVDTSPVLEKALAVNSGLGWQGKNTLVLNPKWGSQFFIGELFTDIPLECFQAKLQISDHCGKCQACIDACPTQALTPYVLDASKCISYWTLEHRGAFTPETPSWSEWIAGCDICQEVCPWNQKLIPIDSVSSPFETLTASDLDSPSWPATVSKTALSYMPPENWRRNLKAIQKQN